MFKAFIKLRVLKLLSRESLSGYDLMKQFGRFGEKASPGYIYPLLNDLKKKGFISLKEDKRRKVYSITNKGRKLFTDLQENREEMINKMKELWKPLADKAEIGIFGSMDSEMKKFWYLYKKNVIKNKGEIKRIVKDSIKRMEKL